MDIISAPSSAPLTDAQQAALKKLHDAATQLEGVFVGMLFKEMHSDAPETDIFGKVSNAEQTWNDMLDEKRADAIAKTGSFGIAKMVEQQLRGSVLGSASAALGASASAAAASAAASSAAASARALLKPAVPPAASSLPLENDP
jgi:Rod binding domain-containing protein